MHNTLAIPVCIIALVLTGFSNPANADELVQQIQTDLVRLGYEPGNTDGEITTETTVAIAKFQAEREMPVTGEASPLLAGIISAEADKKAAGSATESAAPTRSPEELRAAQQLCLERKMAEAQASAKKKRGLGRLMSAVSKAAGMSGNYDLAQTTSDVYTASSTAEDLSAAAKDLGLTEDDIAECQNP